MNKENKTPLIRFKGFSDDWEQRKLGEVGTTYTGLSGKSKEDFGHGEGKFITYMNVFSNAISDSEMVEPIEIDTKQNEVKKGDVFFTTSSETPEEVGMSSVLLEDCENTYLNSFCFGYRPIEKFDNRYLAFMLRSSEMRKKITFLAQGISRYNISKNRMMEIEIPIPSLSEQQKIGSYFQSLDNLITLHQCKCESLKKVKKSMLQKMFPKNGESVPEIRFAGFTDDWEQRKFYEIFNFMQNNALSRAELSNDYGEVMNVHYGDILVKYGEILDVKKDEVTYLLNSELLKKYQTSVLQNGDIIIADAAEDETVGKCSEITGLSNEIVLSGLHTIPCRPKEKYAKGYLGFYMNSNAYHDQLLPLLQGTKVSSISKSAIQDTNIVYPKSETEQAKIGSYFQSLDNLITLHQRKVEKLKNIKKSMLQKMFV